jgi:transcriptional regulator with XRE-family HTH domain
MATILKTVGGNIRRMRKHAKLTLEELAERAESNPKYLGAVERGEENIGLKKLEQVASALRIEPYELLLPGEEDGLAKELIASIKTADQSTQEVMLDVAKRIPEWKEMLSAKKRPARK